MPLRKSNEEYSKNINKIIQIIGNQLRIKYPNDLPARTYIIEEAHTVLNKDFLQKTVNLGKCLEKETPKNTCELVETIVTEYFGIGF